MVATFGKHYSLISQFRENVISFHFLANALINNEAGNQSIILKDDRLKATPRAIQENF